MAARSRKDAEHPLLGVPVMVAEYLLKNGAFDNLPDDIRHSLKKGCHSNKGRNRPRLHHH